MTSRDLFRANGPHSVDKAEGEGCFITARKHGVRRVENPVNRNRICLIDFGVESLKPDQVLDIGVHVGLRESYQTPVVEGWGPEIGRRTADLGRGTSEAAHAVLSRAGP